MSKCNRCAVDLTDPAGTFSLASRKISALRGEVEVKDYWLCEPCFLATLGDVIAARNKKIKKEEKMAKENGKKKKPKGGYPRH